jgi:hypothetical protein
MAAFIGASWILLSCSRAADVDFNRDVRPILASRCFKCHGADETHREAELRLDSADDATLDRGGHAAIVPGDPDASELITRVASNDESLRMPPVDDGPALSVEEIATLRAWIAAGAEYKRHWAFIPPTKSPLPESDSEWPANEIDKFVLARLECERLQPSPEADRRTLVRRLYLDLTGLPPSIAEVDAFLADDEPHAYERLVDSVLASPRCAERLAVAWLDSARYADTNGFSIDDHREMWAWRDWVIAAYLHNMPYDEFLRDQLAGDLLLSATPQQQLATAFLRNSMNTHEGGTLPEEYHVISIADKVDAAATCFLGLTMKCAQCHDHKYDPITQRDYYRFFALFNDSTEPGSGAKNGNTEPTIPVESPLTSPEAFRAQMDRRIADLERQLAELTPELRIGRDAWAAAELERLRQLGASEALDADATALRGALEDAVPERTVEQRAIVDAAFRKAHLPAQQHAASIEEELRIARAARDSGGRVMVMDHKASDRRTHLLARGQYDQPGEVVEPGVPLQVASELPPDVDNRLELAAWLTDPRHPLTARVAVNRVWQLLYGVGLVETSEDFGTRGAWPSHPELLDWLAVDFVEHGWDVRRLLRQIALSANYRQTSNVTPDLLARDPANRLLARGPAKRLDAEFVRDNALAIAGMLSAEIGGPSVYPDQPAGLWQAVSHYGHPEVFTAQAYYPSLGVDARRRSMYSFWKRTCPPPSLAVFDAPSRETCMVRRGSTTTPLQSLVLLNDPQFVDAARRFALRTIAAGEKTDERLESAFTTALARPPSKMELGIFERRLESLEPRFANNPDAAREVLGEECDGDFAHDVDQSELASWTILCSTILNLRETVTSY